MNPDYSQIGALGRAVNSRKQKEASRINGAKGGRPLKHVPCPDCGHLWYLKDLDEHERCPACSPAHRLKLRLEKIDAIERQIEILNTFRDTLQELSRNIEKLREL